MKDESISPLPRVHTTMHGKQKGFIVWHEGPVIAFNVALPNVPSSLVLSVSRLELRLNFGQSFSSI